MVKSADVMVAPVDVDVVAPVVEVEAAGVGIPDWVEVVAPLTDVVAAATGVGPPVLEIWLDAPFVFVVAAAVGAGADVTVGTPVGVTVGPELDNPPEFVQLLPVGAVPENVLPLVL
jgi:hypothetical protein